MKILIDARMYGLENTGIGKYVMELLANIIDVDSSNHYFIILRDKYYKELSFPDNFKKIKGDFRQYSFSEQLLIPKIIREVKPDLVHFPHFNVPVLFKGNYVVTIHDLLMHKQKGFEATTLNPFVYLIKRLAYRFVFDAGVRRAKIIIVPSKTVKKELLGYYQIPEEKVIVTYEGVSELAGNISISEVVEKYKVENPYFIYTGNAYPHKNLKRLIEAVVSLNKGREEKVSLVIISARTFFVKKLAKLVEKLDAKPYVKLLGFLPDSEVKALYKGSVGFIFPTLSEGFGIPGLEAMQTGTLVLCSQIPVLEEVYKDRAIYFNPFDFTSITTAMEQVLDISTEEREARVAASLDFVKRYSWLKMAQETLIIYNKVQEISEVSVQR